MSVLTAQSNTAQAFPDLDPQNSGLSQQAENLQKRIKRLGATQGAKRLELVCTQCKDLTVEEAYHMLNPEEVLSEIEESRSRWVGILYVIRHGLALGPLILTWFALYHAASDYQRDLATPGFHDDVYQPFLRLWQEGFHGTSWLTFSTAAILDVILLLIYLSAVLFVPLIDWWTRRVADKLVTELQSFTDQLMKAISVVGSSSTLSENDVNKISNAIGRQFDRAMLKSNQVAQEARDFIAKSKDHVDKVVGKFDTDLATFNTDVQLLTTKLDDLGTNLQNYDQKLKDLTDASTQLATSSGSLTKSADVMALSADKSAQASQGISTQLSTLNTTQQQIVATQQKVADTIEATQKDVVKEISTTQQKVADKIEATQKDVAATQQKVADTIEATQKDVVKEISTTQQKVADKIETTQKDVAATQQQIVKGVSDAADKMDEVAKDTRSVAKELGQITQADLQAMTKKVADAADQVTKVANGLSQIDKQLQATTQAVANSLVQADQQLQAGVQATMQAVASNLSQVDQQLQATTKALAQAAQALAATSKGRRRWPWQRP